MSNVGRRLLVLLATLAATTATAVGEPPKRPAYTDPQRLLQQILQSTAPPPQVAGESAEADSGLPDGLAPPEKAEVTVGDTGLLNVHVHDVDLSAVLEILSYQSKTNIVAGPSVSGTISANLYDVTLMEALEAVLAPHNLSYRRVGKTIFVGTVEELDKHRDPPETRVFPLRYISTSEGRKALEAVLGERGEVAVATAASEGASSGGSSSGGGAEEGNDDVGTRYLLVTTYPDLFAPVERVLAKIDVRPPQILIESTILRATLNDSNELGIDFSVLGGVDFRMVGASNPAAANVTVGALPTDEFDSTNFNVRTGFSGNVGNGGLSFGIIKNNVGIFLKALESVTDVVVVANPKIVTLNNQPAEVIVGRRDGYLTTTVTETAAVQTVEFLETGTQIKLTPHINADGTVRLRVRPKDSNGGLTSDNLPFEETTEANTSLLVEDGHTVLIGGLFRERTTRSRSQIPLLGGIPLAGALFRSSVDGTIREEVIILLTVHVLKDDAEEQRTYTELLADVERVRVGTRRGLLGIGRERLAQAFYQEAIRQQELGNLDAALLNARMALHNNPKLMPAITLKERLLGRRIWSDEGSRIRNFALELIGHGRRANELLGRPDAATPLGVGEEPQE